MSHNRRTILKGAAATAGASALGFPAIVRAQADKIKIGHLTPLTGFLGAPGEYAVMGIRMAEEEINKSGGVMGRQIEIMSEDSVNPATAATKAQRMFERDGATVLLGEINSASALTISQVAARNMRVPQPASLIRLCCKNRTPEAKTTLDDVVRPVLLSPVWALLG